MNENDDEYLKSLDDDVELCFEVDGNIKEAIFNSFEEWKERRDSDLELYISDDRKQEDYILDKKEICFKGRKGDLKDFAWNLSVLHTGITKVYDGIKSKVEEGM